MKILLLAFMLLTFAALPTLAQEDDSPLPRTAPIVNGNVTGGAINSTQQNQAQLEIRLSAIEDQMRQLQGKLEEANFQVKKLSDTLDKQQKDYEMRFSDIEKKQAAPQTTAAKAGDAANIVEGKPIKNEPEYDAQKSPTDQTNAPATAKDLYNYALRLFNQTKYDDAAKAFATFTKKYAKDPLVGNAFYWDGETYYIRRDYVNAADNFRQGFEALPNGPKAPENLLKLGESLDALNRDKEACIVLQQVVVKFKRTAMSVADKASEEQKRIGCQKPPTAPAQ